MSLALWLSYAAICLLFAATPGPSVILAVGQGIARGFRSSLSLIAGIQLGNAIYFTISAAGLGVVLATSELAFLTLKYAGAAYLVFIGVTTIKDAGNAANFGHGEATSLWRQPFVQGAANQLANPKSILFFGAMFPQFMDYSAPNLLPQFAILGATIVVIDSLALAFYAALAAQGRAYMNGRRSARLRETLSGAALVGVGAAFGLNLA